MRLINVRTSKAEGFLDDSIPPYAILSHTWGPDSEELTYRDIEEGNVNKPGVGSAKLVGSCRQAQEDGLEYVWIDTCCIDKRDLVELNEAINSMFRWYMRASVCYVYLSDVPTAVDVRDTESEFWSSRWFRRGWTLQELLAPRDLRFYSREWQNIGTKGKLCGVLESITSIPRPFLLGIAELGAASVAQRMSWAAHRDTKRKEDIAYCLLGLFNVTMPLIYGEGKEQAFFRLQEHIMKKTRDDSILAWGFGPKGTSRSSKVVAGGILATSPSDFENSEHIVRRDHSITQFNSLELSGGNLRTYLQVHTTSNGETIGMLTCGPQGNVQEIVGIPLAALTPNSNDIYFRPRGWHSQLCSKTALSILPKLIHIRNDSQNHELTSAPSQQYIMYDDQFAEFDLDLIEVMPHTCWDEERALIASAVGSDDGDAPQVFIRLRHSLRECEDFLIAFEFDGSSSNIKAQYSTMICDRDTSLRELAGVYRYIREKYPGYKSASNGILNLEVVLEPLMQQSVLALRLKALSSPPDATFHASAEVQMLSIVLSLVKNFNKDEQELKEVEETKKGLEGKETRLEDIRERRRKIEDEIRKLQDKVKVLAQQEAILEEERAKIHEFQKHDDDNGNQLSTDEAQDSVQKLWGQFWRMEGNTCAPGSQQNNSSTLFQWAVKNQYPQVAQMCHEKESFEENEQVNTGKHLDEHDTAKTFVRIPHNEVKRAPTRRARFYSLIETTLGRQNRLASLWVFRPEEKRCKQLVTSFSGRKGRR